MYYKIFSLKKNQNILTKKRLSKHNYKWIDGVPTKILAIFSINNWEDQLLEPLRSLGDVTHFSWNNIDNFFDSKSERELVHNKINNDLVSVYDKIYDVNSNIIVFLYASDFIISETTLRHFKMYNTLIISFCWDDLLYFKGKVKGQPVGVSMLSSNADINLTLSPEAISRYNYFNSPCFFWSSLKKNIFFEPKYIDTNNTEFYVLFIGSKYGHREDFIRKLISKGIKVRCFGKGWPNGNISNEQMKFEIENAPVTLGFSNVGYTRKITTIKGRDFEVPLYNGLYLTQFSKGLELYYKPYEEILTYKNLSDCIRQIQWIEKNTIKANKIRFAGYQRAIEYCSWDSRMAYLKNLINDIVSNTAF